MNTIFMSFTYLLLRSFIVLLALLLVCSLHFVLTGCCYNNLLTLDNNLLTLLDRGDLPVMR